MFFHIAVGVCSYTPFTACTDADCALPPMWHPVSLQSRAVRWRCPGMGEHRSRKENMELGIPVAEEKWAEVLAM